MKQYLMKLSYFKRMKKKLNNLNERTEFVKREMSKISEGSKLLDAGCGSQQFRIFASHLNYKAQDFGKYESDEKQLIGDVVGGAGGQEGYQYGELDYVGNIWEIDAPEGEFDAILCTEVFEHIPYPSKTVREFSRLLKSGGKLILTVPGGCLRHMDPFFFYTGFSDRWLDYFLLKNGFTVERVDVVGDYYSWISVELMRTMKSSSWLRKLILLPAFLLMYHTRATDISKDSLCEGYHVVAVKK